MTPLRPRSVAVFVTAADARRREEAAAAAVVVAAAAAAAALLGAIAKEGRGIEEEEREKLS